MGYRSTRACVDDLRRHGQLVEFDELVSARLQIAAIQRRLYSSQGPAVLFTRVEHCAFPMVANLFGTLERARFLFRDTLARVRQAIELRTAPHTALRRPLRYWKAPLTAWTMRARRVRGGPVQQHEIRLGQLPQLVSWPRDGGPFVTLPQVYTEDPAAPGFRRSNLGMYRIQLGGNHYEPDREAGLHYQIHRSIGVHHAAALRLGKPFPVNVFVGGAPAMTLAAVMPLPEGMSELGFAGALAGHRIPMICRDDRLPVYADADFCISGTVVPDKLLPEGPFGDHLGYYSLQHDFPVLAVERVWHREGAIWPFTVVGRPPQEDTVFGALIHELTGPVIPAVLPGVHAVHAVDSSGVHPLLLAIGSERYTPWQETTAPAELLTQANAILGQGQLSLAKYLMILDRQADPGLDVHDEERFLYRMLERVDWTRDLHFQTCTTMDTLDYSGTGLNQGSRVVIAAAGPARRTPARELPVSLSLPEGFSEPRLALPGILVLQGPRFTGDRTMWWPELERSLRASVPANSFPLIAIVDDSRDCAKSLRNFLWTVFTRSNPAADIYGVDSFVADKHWGAQGSLVIDSRIKAHHAPLLEEDPGTTRFVDAIAARGTPISRWL